MATKSTGKEKKEIKSSKSEKEVSKSSFMEKILSFLKKCRVNCEQTVEEIKSSGKIIIWTVVCTFCTMFIMCLAVFFASVEGAEKVLVPNVIGKSLPNAILDLGKKELYPKLQIKYVEDMDKIGKVIEQNPAPNAIVKAYRKVTITVCRPYLESYENYVGQNLADIKENLDILFAGNDSENGLLKISFTKSDEEKGTIIAQYPNGDISLDDEKKLFLMVSNGNEINKVSVPKLLNLNLKNLYASMEENNLIYDFEAVYTNDNIGHVISQSLENGTEVDIFSRVNLKINISNGPTKNETIQGIYNFTLPEYPYAVPMKFESFDSEGNTNTIVSFVHTGKNISIPYEVSPNTTLSLYVMDELKNQIVVQ